MNEVERFLNNFKKLEAKIVDISQINEGFVSFSRALNRVHFNRLNILVADDEIFEFLKTASDLRNILSHEVNVCSPTTEFNDRFEEIVVEITNPLECYDISTKGDDILYVYPKSNVIEVVEMMEKMHISHVPVISDNRVIGVFSRSVFFEYVFFNKSIKVDNTYVISDFLRVTEVSNHLNDSYIFISKDVKAYSLLRYFIKKKSGDKRVSVIFITENGKSNEKLLGVLTEADLLKLPLYERKVNTLGK